VSFPFQNRFLTRIGLVSPYEQYAFYGSIGLTVFGSLQPLRKAYWINRWIHETNPEYKIMIAGRANLSQAERDAAKLFLQHYSSVPKKLALVPIVFITFEFIRSLFKKHK
jgi:hypothetical protein